MTQHQAPLFTLALMPVLLTACLGGGGNSSASSSGSNDLVLNGVFVDAEVAGLAYRTSSGLSGTTDASGRYRYRLGDSITFSVGGINLGSAEAGDVLTPSHLLAATSPDDPKVVAMVQLLTTLDADGKPENGIEIRASSAQALAEPQVFSNASMQILSRLAGQLAAGRIYTVNRTVTPPEVAQRHYLASLKKLEERISDVFKTESVLVGGGLVSCSSWSSKNCSASWSEILAQDPAFGGFTMAQLQDASFDANKAGQMFSYQATPAKINSLLLSPFVDEAARRNLEPVLASVIAEGRLAQPVSWTDARLAINAAAGTDSFVLFGDGDYFWNRGDEDDFYLVLDQLLSGSKVGSYNNAANRYVVNSTTIAKVEAVKSSFKEDAVKVLAILRFLQKNGQLASNGVDYSSLKAAVVAVKVDEQGRTADQVPGFVERLAPSIQVALREALVVAVPVSPRRYELRSTVFNSNTDSQAIYKRFVDAARSNSGKQKPKIVVISAATENPYWDVDINVSALNSAGADAVWLPISGALRQAYQSGSCDAIDTRYSVYANKGSAGGIYHQHLLFPDYASQQVEQCAKPQLLLSVLASADGIYFSGGDQARILEALLDRDGSQSLTIASPELKALRARFDAGKLVVSGTSAGSAVQGGGRDAGKALIPMLGGGDSYNALLSGFAQGSGPTPDDAGTSAIRYAEGGLGFFGHGIVDTHFSKRSREGRLIRIAKEAGVRYGFGIDENTALVTSRKVGPLVQMSVVGAGGVFIADVAAAKVGSEPGKPYVIEQVRAHYLTSGDRVVLNTRDGEIKVLISPLKTSQSVTTGAAAVSSSKVFEYGAFGLLDLVTAQAKSGAVIALGDSSGSSGQAQPVMTLRTTRERDTVMALSTDGKLSYRNLQIEIRPR
ncbi:hypothetical protein EHS17_07785 [Rhodobacteraceae bacterium CH30]|nr:hypothetical protein EHS17_07785 [Rhodobacteraceae bacterium CH30]